jgi:hypothetical protein
VPLIQQLLSLIVIVWLPGAVLFRIPIGNRARRYTLPPEERVFWQVLVSLGAALAAAVGLAWFGRYEFRWLLLIQAGLGLLPLALWRGRLRVVEREGLTPAAALPILLLIGGWQVFLAPSEYVIAGKDPGTYVGEGVQIAQRGALVIHDEVVSSVPVPLRDLFFPSHETEDYYSIRFMGFFIQDPAAGTVVGQFPHLFPAALAIGYGLDGLTGVRFTTPVLAMLGVLAVYFAGVHLFGRLTGFAAACLLLVNVVQVWFGRYPNAEVLMQVFVFAVILAVMHQQTLEDGWFAVVAGLLLGLLLFLRFDTAFAVAAVFAALILQTLTGKRFPWLLPASLLIPGALVIVYTGAIMDAYAARYLAFVRFMPWWQHAGLVIGLATLAATVRAGRRHPRVRELVVEWTPVLIAVTCCGAALYALYLRQPAGRLAVHDAHALRTYAAFYVTVPAVLAAILAFALFVRGWFWRAPVFYLVAAAFAGFIFYKIRIVPEHFWAARRLLPVILPSTMLLVAALAVGGRSFGPWWFSSSRTALGLIFLLLLGSGYLRASAPVRAHVEYEGLIPRLETLASQFGDEDLVIVESRDAGSDTHVFAMPLAYIYARNVLVLNSARPDKITLAEFVGWASTKYRAIYFVGAGGSDLLSYSYSLEPIASDRFQVPEYESAYNGYPRGPRRKEFEYGIYRFGPAGERRTGPFELDIGRDDNLHVLRFHSSEESDGRTFRWTGPQSFVSITSVSPGSREVVLIAGDGGRPAAAPAAIIDVFLDGQRLGSAVVKGGFAPHTFVIPPALAARAAAAQNPVELRIVSTTWRPSEVLGSGDGRQLGVMLDRVAVK